MNTFLLTIAITSLAAAAVFAVITWRLLAGDRQRAAARVAALGAAIDAADRPPALSRDVARAELFGAAPPTVGSRPLVKVAAIGAMAILLIVIVAVSSNDAGHDAGNEPGPRPAAQTATSSLELLSMRYARVGETLTVSGLVRNASDETTGLVTAVVFAFDRTGGFLASGRAPLEFNRLASGDESPFQVTIPHLADVGRYRVSFRSDAGTVPHVDRRAEALRASVTAR
jgi:hypothetical protein